MAGEIDIDARERFERDGYLIFDPGLAEDVLSTAVADIGGQFELGWAEPGPPPRERRRGLRGRLPGDRKLVPAASYRDGARVQDAWRISKGVKQIARAPAVLSLLGELFGRKALPFQTLNFKSGTEQEPHSDAIHFNSEPPGFMCGVWVALEDVGPDQGPLVYYPGSHRLPEVSMAEIGAPRGQDHYGEYTAYVHTLIEREGLQPSYGTLSKGQALVWAPNLLHGGAKQTDPNRTRLSQVTHYFFEGCRYWTPMLSDQDHVEWREPEWVR